MEVASRTISDILISSNSACSSDGEPRLAGAGGESDPRCPEEDDGDGR